MSAVGDRWNLRAISWPNYTKNERESAWETYGRHIWACEEFSRALHGILWLKVITDKVFAPLTELAIVWMSYNNIEFIHPNAVKSWLNFKVWTMVETIWKFCGRNGSKVYRSLWRWLCPKSNKRIFPSPNLRLHLWDVKRYLMILKSPDNTCWDKPTSTSKASFSHHRLHPKCRDRYFWRSRTWSFLISKERI